MTEGDHKSLSLSGELKIWWLILERFCASRWRWRQSAKRRVVALSSCLKRGMPNGALSCGVLS
jgi:hypothetical protein